MTKRLLTALSALAISTAVQAAPLSLPAGLAARFGQALAFLNRTEVRNVLRFVGVERYLSYVPHTAVALPAGRTAAPARKQVTIPNEQPVDRPVTVQPIYIDNPVNGTPAGNVRYNPPKRNGRHDNGRHKGWETGRHEGWNKHSPATPVDPGDDQSVAGARPGQQGR